MGWPGSFSEWNVLDMTLSLLWPVKTGCAACSIHKEYSSAAICVESPERGVYRGVVKGWRRAPKGVLWGIERGGVLALWLDEVLAGLAFDQACGEVVERLNQTSL